MATAPRPGGQRALGDATKRYRIRVRDVTLEFPAALSIQERFTIRSMTGGFPLETLFRQPGEDLLAVLWWLARRRNGDPRLSIDDAYADISGVSVEDFDVEVIDDDGEETDDPE